jgi:Grap2 and cyclin-D-interacting
MILFLREIVEIVTGESTVDSQERLTCSGMMMQECDRIQRLCKEGPMVLLRNKLELTEEMLKDAMDELEVIVDTTSMEEDDEWPRDDSPEQKEFAIRTQKVLKLLSLLYKAILKRRVTIQTGYNKSMLTKLDGIYVALEELNVAVDELVSGFYPGDKEPMTLELELIHLVDEAQSLSKAVREPLDGGRDTQVEWFDMWDQKMKES